MVSLRAWRGLLTFAQVVSASPFDGAPTSTGLPDRESRLNEQGRGLKVSTVGGHKLQGATRQVQLKRGTTRPRCGQAR